MSAAVQEQPEALAPAHAAPEQSKSPNISKMIGLTMAVMGVLNGFCSALVGGARTELTKTMVEQTQAASAEQGQATRFRMLFSQLEELVAIAPTSAQVHALRHQLEVVKARTPPSFGEAVGASWLVGTKVSEMLAPTEEPLARLIGQVRQTKQHLARAHTWTGAYDRAVQTHFDQAEGFERAQLCAEVGIVIASIALLLKSRRIWYGSLAMGGCAILLCMLYASRWRDLESAEAQVQHAHRIYQEAAEAPDMTKSDDDTLHAIEHGMSPSGLRVAHPAGADDPVPSNGDGKHP